LTYLGVNAEASGGLAAPDRHIDNLVYELYGLTAEEIAVVEGR